MTENKFLKRSFFPSIKKYTADRCALTEGTSRAKTISAGSAWFYGAAFAGLLAFFWVCSNNAVFRNDELQHLRVACAAAAGETPYRDFFDNHMPLFHMVSALEISAVKLKPGPDFPVKMRHLAFPFFMAQIFFLALLAGAVFFKNTEESLSCALLAGVFLPFMAVQTRPEPMWGALFIASIYFFSANRPSVKNLFLVGLINGLGACVSLKTMAFPALAELMSLPALAAFYAEGVPLPAVAAMLGGLALFPSLLLLHFYRLGALKDFLKYAVFYSIRAGGEGGTHWQLQAGLLILAAVLVYYALRALKNVLRPAQAAFAAACFLSGFILLFYPVREAQTVFPLRALLYLVFAALTVKALRNFPAQAAKKAALLFLAVGAAFGRLAAENAFSDRNSDYKRSLALMLRLQPAAAGGSVMDAKGESLFWKRPYYYALERFAMQGVRNGTLADSVPQDMARTATPVVFLKFPARFSAKDLAFFSSNYLPLCSAPEVLAAGKEITGKFFETAVALEYALICEDGGRAVGRLDGKNYSGAPVAMPPGRHSFVPGKTNTCARPILLWAKAAELRELPCPRGSAK
ncbi:MAG: hypothetical protein NTX59_12795 [Elusimicrobia bacterium]|nr:hypothetical protein [Elusimicrobiota bacterium]